MKFGPYSTFRKAGDLVFVSGQLPICPTTGKIETEIKAATIQMFRNMEATLAEAGLTMANVVKVNVFMKNLEQFTEMNETYAQCFAEPFPARSCVQVCRLPKDAIIEAECIAHING